ncbi:glutelin type-A 1-like [Ananas comosus]|nr:glutelin type-A 1-like [Ananas comosus]
MGVNREVARRLQSQNDQRGEIVRVEHGLHLMRPSFGEQQPPMEAEEEMERREQRGCPSTNGLDETYCTMKIKENINEASRADIYNPQGGRITYVNTQKLPILNLVQMSAARGVLRRNAMLAPLWSINAHSVMFVTQGHARIQVVNNQGRTVFDGEVRRNQLLVIPQNYAVIMRAGREGCEWVSFKTNSNAMVSQITGKASAFRGMPVDVLMNSYRLSREEALRLKFNRGDEMGIFAPKFQRAWSFT